MNLQNVQPGDIVQVEKKQGWKFLAYVESRSEQNKQEWNIKPVANVPSYHTCTSREITEHYKKMRRQRQADKARAA
jgi:hypothetical protein